ncbi:hypothetical protein PT7_2569 [Pusillimonas sp. T7-7]|uniref:hypothetical protein n=1 Tax=Pusillimonas sp. (strain T7-7) TaxID=1007105 RepID=UPI0002084B80|nr:hypothetical protein [Pusillimonas sp. T7-7]AEC21109.1 hypothetical protein PT7_2569 [Pusillimonas sp. T7-7]
MLSHLRPSVEEHTQLLQELGPLPIKGPAWPKWLKVLAWVVLAFIGLQIIRIAAGPLGQNISPMVSGSIIVCYIGLLILARYMHVSETSITETGIQQSWLSRREVSWEDIQFVKFIPLLASKKMICFLGRGRPVVFQAGTKELQIAFARISLVYRRRK